MNKEKALTRAQVIRLLPIPTTYYTLAQKANDASDSFPKPLTFYRTKIFYSKDAVEAWIAQNFPKKPPQRPERAAPRRREKV